MTVEQVTPEQVIDAARSKWLGEDLFFKLITEGSHCRYWAHYEANLRVTDCSSMDCKTVAYLVAPSLAELLTQIEATQ